MKIAIDVDDCISNTREVDFAMCWKFNKQKHPDDDKLYFNDSHNAPTIFGFSKEEDDEFYIKQRPEVIKEGLIYPKIFAPKIINKLLEDGHDITILTSRGDLYWGNALEETEKWLAKYGINYTRCVANSGNKGDYCRENGIELLIEDNPKYAKQANDANVKSLLILEIYNKDYQNPLNTFASCWPEVYYKINEMTKQSN